MADAAAFLTSIGFTPPMADEVQSLFRHYANYQATNTSDRPAWGNLLIRMFRPTRVIPPPLITPGVVVPHIS